MKTLAYEYDNGWESKDKVWEIERAGLKILKICESLPKVKKLYSKLRYTVKSNNYIFQSFLE